MLEVFINNIIVFLHYSYYGQNITSYCKTGYEHPDGSTTASVECSINGTWIYPPTECQSEYINAHAAYL